MDQKKNFKRTTVTAALPYANGPIHIGHMAGVYIPADTYVRYQRLKQKDVLFICGSDEHGVPITLRAKEEGVEPKDIVDRYHKQIKESFESFGIQFDHYSRTSSKTHHETASDFFKTLDEKDVLEVKTSLQYFDPQEKQFLADRYIKGTCPNCSYPEAYGDQCENCGTSLSPKDLKDPRSMLSGAAPILKETKHWFLPLDKYEGWLKEFILEGHKEWKSNVYGQCKSWIDQGLQPRAVTRDLDWGVPVPHSDGKGKVLYVWFDAPIGYISATKEWAEKNSKDWETYWKDEETKLVHFIGKDNIVFHCIIFPSMLKSHEEFILPDNVPANEFLNLEGDKISTSRNWAVWLHEYLEDFQGKEDVLRYVLTSNAPETKDNDFSWKDFQSRNNNELVAILGNFVNRTLVLTHKYFDGKIPAKGQQSEVDENLLQAIKLIPSSIEKNIEEYKFREALNQFIELSRLGNKYLAETEPWKLIKEDQERVATILNQSLQLCAQIAIYGEPFLPGMSNKLSSLLGLENKNWESELLFERLEEGNSIQKPELLFSKIEDEAIAAQLEKLKPTEKPPSEDKKSKSKPMIEYSDFEKLDLKVARILEAEKVPETDKLIKLQLEVGEEKRTVVSGIALSYDPESIIGRSVLYLENLKPRKIRGLESQGMILMAEDASGNLSFMVPEKEMNSGSGVR